MKLNKEELFVGGVVALSLIGFIHWWVIPIIPLCAILWALGGAKGIPKLVRRVGVPIVLCLTAYLLGENPILTLTTLPLLVLAFSVGYGTPTVNNYGNVTDEGSWLGRFWFKVFEKDTTYLDFVELLVRLSYGFLIALAMLPLVFLSPLDWLLAFAVLIFGVPLAVIGID